MLGLAFRFKMGLPALAIHPVRWVSKVQQTWRRKNGGLLHFVSTARNFGSGVRYGGLAAPTEATRYDRDGRTHKPPRAAGWLALQVSGRGMPQRSTYYAVPERAQKLAI